MTLRPRTYLVTPDNMVDHLSRQVYTALVHETNKHEVTPLVLGMALDRRELHDGNLIINKQENK